MQRILSSSSKASRDRHVPAADHTRSSPVGSEYSTKELASIICLFGTSTCLGVLYKRMEITLVKVLHAMIYFSIIVLNRRSRLLRKLEAENVNVRQWWLYNMLCVIHGINVMLVLDNNKLSVI